eukprot:GHVU01101951.1.p2 GENE.GHVU01101951.1~~GHVU01101951.1.p2  ORF type:complete len:125 (-),score=2.96 GHVU01101951.1:296-670(-)
MQPGGSFIIAINIHHRGKTILSTPNFNSQQGSKMNADDIVVVLKMVPRAHVQTVWGRARKFPSDSESLTRTESENRRSGFPDRTEIVACYILYHTVSVIQTLYVHLVVALLAFLFFCVFVVLSL